MRGMSIRLKITLWFSAALLIVTGLTFLTLISISRRVMQKTIKEGLIATVENNVDEVEFYKSIDDINLTEDVDYFLPCGEGYVEIDDDFLDAVNGAYTSLYSLREGFLYGENPIAAESEKMPFRDRMVQRTAVSGTNYYVFDRKLDGDGLEGMWLRGVVSEDAGKVQLASVAKTWLLLLPFVVVGAIVGGYIMAGRLLKPVGKIADAADRISKGGDLKQRIELGSGSGELHRLADSFNEMFARLDESFTAQRQFTSDASHELRTPMAVIMARCELTLEKQRTEEEYRQSIRTIMRQGRKMTKLIDDMLAFARLELKAEQYVMENTDISALARSVCLDMATIEEKGITLKENIGQNINANANGELVARLLSNLISNAYRYGKENGHIWVKLEEKGENIILTVEDDGIGIEEDQLDKIFLRFYRADNARDGNGTGLGLAMVKEIAGIHGGEIGVESRLDQGSKFTFKMPKK